ncbi:hypothetical protein NP439_06740 [Oceanobacillus jeddahense]|uniref:RDD domain-containing protein n=1 Tax=Oceanobacillus jeddahense TaxID=1462527 RepID=A0ABY5K0P3_9BACI|nr:hypothetical protein [Oceanobacillus jeddahense]UUI04344.1 hypothetical protein NP439_06740 [Oceanobacillus jeddahense]
MRIFGHEFTGMGLVIAIFLIAILYPTIKLNIRLLMIQTNPSRRLLGFIENLLSERKLPRMSNTVFLVLYFSLFLVQRKYEIKFIEYQQQYFDLVGVYGFVIGLLSMYGIYIGFLQFIVGDSDKVRYLGRSKIKYLTDTSIWYQITQTKPFLVILFLTIISPILIINTNGELQDSLIYAWQASITMLLWIYIFLIGMSLQIIRILFLIKGKTDLGLENIIRESISSEYYNLFRKMYRSKFKTKDIQHFFKVLEFDVSKVDTQSIGCFLINVFSKIDMEVGSEYGEFKSVRIGNHSYGEDKEYLYDDYKRFISEKWELLSTIQKKMDWYYLKKLIDRDMNTFNYLVADTPMVFEEKDDEFEFRYVFNKQMGNVHHYLFDQLVEKAVSDSNKMEDLYKDINDNTREIEFRKVMKDKKADLIKYFAKVEKYKWEKIFKKYIFSESQFDLPDFSRYNNDELYSQAVFKYLTSNHSNLRESILENKKLDKLISSMNKKYFVAYSLYQLFYPDSEEWNDNTVYFKNKLINVFDWAEEEEKKELYISSAKIVSETRINHRVTFKVLTTIYEDREKQIANMDYFNQFDNSLISPLKILFIQGILSPDNKYSHRIILTKQQTKNDLRMIENLCMEFLRVVDKIPKITTYKELANTMEYLLLETSLDMKRLVHDVTIISLLYYEFIITFKKDVWAGNLFLESVTLGEEGKTSIYFWNESIFTFFALQMMDSNYEQFFANKQFFDAFKSGGISTLDKADMTLDEYIEAIYEKLKNAIYGKIGKASLRQISIKLEKILFD